MKRVVPYALSLLLLAFTTTPALATTNRYHYECTETVTGQPVEGTFWVEGDVFYLRGSVYTYSVAGDEYCAGSLTVTVNFNLDTSTGSGVLWGTSDSSLTAFDGGFTTHWTAHWTAAAPLDPAATHIWTGKYVGHGYGDLEGWQSRATIHELTHSTVVEHGYAFLPGD